MNVRTEYDAWHRRLFESAPQHDDASSPWYRLVREKIGTVSGLRVLEVACGRGGFVRELCASGADVTGCDFSFEALRVGATKLRASAGDQKVTLVQADVQQLPFAAGSFDVVISCETIEHVPDVPSSLREMHRVTRAGGRLFLTTPNYANVMGLYAVYARIRHRRRRDDQPFDRRQWFLQVRRHVRQAGWRIVGSDGTVHQAPLLFGRNPIAFPRIESNRTVRRLLSPFAYHYFLLACKAAREP